MTGALSGGGGGGGGGNPLSAISDFAQMAIGSQGASVPFDPTGGTGISPDSGNVVNTAEAAAQPGGVNAIDPNTGAAPNPAAGQQSGPAQQDNWFQNLMGNLGPSQAQAAEAPQQGSGWIMNNAAGTGQTGNVGALTPQMLRDYAARQGQVPTQQATPRTNPEEPIQATPGGGYEAGQRQPQPRSITPQSDTIPQPSTTPGAVSSSDIAAPAAAPPAATPAAAAAATTPSAATAPAGGGGSWLSNIFPRLFQSEEDFRHYLDREFPLPNPFTDAPGLLPNPLKELQTGPQSYAPGPTPEQQQVAQEQGWDLSNLGTPGGWRATPRAGGPDVGPEERTAEAGDAVQTALGFGTGGPSDVMPRGPTPSTSTAGIPADPNAPAGGADGGGGGRRGGGYTYDPYGGGGGGYGGRGGYGGGPMGPMGPLGPLGPILGLISMMMMRGRGGMFQGLPGMLAQLLGGGMMGGGMNPAFAGGPYQGSGEYGGQGPYPREGGGYEGGDGGGYEGGEPNDYGRGTTGSGTGETEAQARERLRRGEAAPPGTNPENFPWAKGFGPESPGGRTTARPGESINIPREAATESPQNASASGGKMGSPGTTPAVRSGSVPAAGSTTAAATPAAPANAQAAISGAIGPRSENTGALSYAPSGQGRGGALRGMQGRNFFQRRYGFNLRNAPPRGSMRDLNTAYGPVTVNPAAANDVQGFFADLAQAGAPLQRVGSYNHRGMSTNRNAASSHAWGTAFDMNDQDGPVRSDMQRWINQDPARWQAILRRHNMSQPYRSWDPNHLEWVGPGRTEVAAAGPQRFQ